MNKTATATTKKAISTRRARSPREILLGTARAQLDRYTQRLARAEKALAKCAHKASVEKARAAVRDAESVLQALGAAAGAVAVVAHPAASAASTLTPWAAKPMPVATGKQPTFDRCPRCNRRSKLASEPLCGICSGSRA